MPYLSVIIPAFGKPEAVEECLASILDSSFKNYQILVADDGSPDAAAVARVAARYGARLIRLDRNRGPAAARNAAARIAEGEILAFFDSDVTLHHDTLARIAEAFGSEPGLDALMGAYDTEPQVTGLAARFRNLLHTHVHRRSSRQATTFWTGCGAVRRGPFFEMGGFDESFLRPSIEDVEFGMRLHRAGGRLRLDPEVNVKHHKQWSLFSMVQTDVVHRAMPWTALMLRYGLPRDLNFRWRDRWSAVCAVLVVLFAALAVPYGSVWAMMSGAALAVSVGLEWSLFRFLARERGALFAAASVPLHLIHLLSGVAGFAAGLVLGVRKRTPANVQATTRSSGLPRAASGAPDPDIPEVGSHISARSPSTP